ncbi:MAG: PleD family two-component system response regulator [Vulcanibacillus sp.]
MGKILVIDDSNLIRTRVIDILNKNGYNNVEGYESADIIARRLQLYLDEVSLIIIDIILPGISGIELITTIKKNPEYDNIPIIFISVNSEKRIINKAIEAGASDYIVKPFEDRVLLERVNKVLKISKEKVSGRFIYDSTTVKDIISIEHERATRGNQPLSFIKLKINTEDMGICNIHLKNIIRKIDMVYILEQNIIIILPLTDQKGASIVLQKIDERVTEFNVEIIEKDIVTYDPSLDDSNENIDKIYEFII